MIKNCSRKELFERRRKDNLLQKTDCLQNQIRSKSICHAAKIHNILIDRNFVANKKCIYQKVKTKKKASFTGYLLYREKTSVTPEITKKIFY